MKIQLAKIYGSTAKAVLGGKFIVIQDHLKKQENPQINNLTLHFKELDKEERTA